MGVILEFIGNRRIYPKYIIELRHMKDSRKILKVSILLSFLLFSNICLMNITGAFAGVHPPTPEEIAAQEKELLKFQERVEQPRFKAYFDDSKMP